MSNQFFGWLRVGIGLIVIGVLTPQTIKENTLVTQFYSSGLFTYSQSKRLLRWTTWLSITLFLFVHG
uniref:Uncharacterized protein n=1 Tax=Pseudobryopsis hainanensis TaxID=2320808 RepID=A0A3S5X2J2_9CHLO|nr:hypothetical protein Ycf47 [Pseudobryopsis hainanensis]